MALDLPPVAGHPNRMAFRGVLTLLDAPSDRPPSGARGHRVLLTREAAETALPSLLGMGLDYAASLDRHEPRRKVGIITEAEIVDSRQSPVAGRQRTAKQSALSTQHSAEQHRPTAESQEPAASLATGNRQLATLTVSGYLFARDFPDVVRELRNAGRLLGMSYEITDARVLDLRAAVWTVTEFTFTGAAVLRRDKAAYRDTWIELEPSPAAVSASGPVLGYRYQVTGDR